MTTICELQLKPPLECIDIFVLLKEKVDLISKVFNVVLFDVSTCDLSLLLICRLFVLSKSSLVLVICSQDRSLTSKFGTIVKLAAGYNC